MITLQRLAWLALLMAALGACTSTKPTAPTVTVETEPPPSAAVPTIAAPKPVPSTIVGASLVVKTAVLGQTDEVRYTLKSAKQHPVSPDGEWKSAKGIWLAIDVDVAVQQGRATACYCVFAFIARDGTVYEAVAGIGFAGLLDSAELNAGQRKGGLVVFDVPKTALVGARIELRDTAGGKPVGHWML